MNEELLKNLHKAIWGLDDDNKIPNTDGNALSFIVRWDDFKGMMNVKENRKIFYETFKKYLDFGKSDTFEKFENKLMNVKTEPPQPQPPQPQPPQPQPPQPQPPQPQPPQPEPVPTLPYTYSSSFNTMKSDNSSKQKAIDSTKVEKEVNKILLSLYKNGVNPKIKYVKFEIEDNGNFYTTDYNIVIEKSNDNFAWVEFKSLGTTDNDYENKRKEIRTNLDNSIPKDQKMQIINIVSHSHIPYLIYFIQLAKPKTNPSHRLKESAQFKKILKKKLNETLNKKEELELKNSIVKKRISTLLESNPKRFYSNLIEEISELTVTGLLNEEDLFSNLVGIYGDSLVSLPETFFEPWMDALVQKLELKDSELSDFLKNKLKENPSEVWNSFVSCEKMSDLVAKGLCETMIYHFQKDVTHDGLDVVIEPVNEVLVSDEFIRKVSEKIQPIICEMFERQSKKAEDILSKLKDISV